MTTEREKIIKANEPLINALKTMLGTLLLSGETPRNVKKVFCQKTPQGWVASEESNETLTVPGFLIVDEN